MSNKLLIDENPFERPSKAQVITLIKQLTGQANLLTTPILFVKALGDMNSAVLLGQILYWQDKTTREDGYFWKSRKEWNDEIGLSPDQVRQATKKLKGASCGLETKLIKADGSPTVHYRLDKDQFLDWVMEASEALDQFHLGYIPNPFGTQNKSLTETTAKTTDHAIISSPHSSEKIAIPSEFALPKTEKRRVEIVAGVGEE